MSTDPPGLGPGDETAFPAYVYESLDADSIRLLRLLPGEPDGELHIELLHTQFKDPVPRVSARMTLTELRKTLPPGWVANENVEGRFIFASAEVWPGTWSHPDKSIDASRYALDADSSETIETARFEALSYVWGSESKPCRVLVSSDVGRGVSELRIGENLASALRHIRQDEESRVLWIDAICINQENNSEKSVQIRKMADIFRQAPRVVVWLGSEGQDSSGALARLQTIAEQVDLLESRAVRSSVEAKYPGWIEGQTKLPFSARDWHSIDSLLRRAWFNRLWVVQEVGLASRNSLVQCGGERILWVDFKRAIACLCVRADSWLERQLLLSHIYLTHRSDRINFALLLHSHSYRKCRHPHDRVYALLGLAPPKIAGAIPVDYTMSVSEVFKATFLSTLQHYERWEIVQCPPVGGQRSSGTFRAPSWVQFPRSELVYNIQYQFAVGNSRTEHTYYAPGILAVAGVQCATVLHAVSPSGSDGGERDFVDTIRAWLGGLPELSKPYVTGGRLLDALARILVQDCTKDRYPVTEVFDLGEWTESDELEALVGSSTDWEDFWSILMDNAYGKSGGRAFMDTAEGYIGLGPIGVATGKHL